MWWNEYNYEQFITKGSAQIKIILLDDMLTK
jgi:hypothetical protein